MAEDREVLREVWDGRIPACFNLPAEEVETMAAPDPYFLMLPRLSYLPLVTDKVRKHFSKFVHQDRQDAEMWFEFNGSPIKWHYPIGVLFDQAKLANAELVLPWTITVHFDKFPENDILHCQSREAVESHFMSCIKEADQIKHGGKVVANMQKKDHNQLWQGLQNDKFDQFWAVNRRLMETTDDQPSFKYIPCRLYDVDQPMNQKLVKTLNAEKQKRTLRDLLEETISDKKVEEVSVLSQGIETPLETPLQWMAEHLSYPDNFLHICIK